MISEKPMRHTRESEDVSSLWITNVRLPSSQRSENDYDGTWTVKCRGGLVTEVHQSGSLELGTLVTEGVEVLDAGGSIMLPSCGDLTQGDLKEALTVTAKAKEDFAMNPDDLYRRGARLIEESVENGVTSMRAHVEVDSIVGFSCLNVALKLKNRYKEMCDVQVAVFAQEALFQNASDTEPGENYTILCKAAKMEGVSVVGSAPYVEPTKEQAKQNIKLIFKAAISPATSLHVDFHLDFNLDPTTEPLIHEVVSQARVWYRLCGFDRVAEDNTDSINPNVVAAERNAGNEAIRPLLSGVNRNPSRPHITIGHATRLVLFTPAEWRALSAAIGDLPITIVGLPQTDMYLQGRTHQGDPTGPPRSALRVPYIEKECGLKVAMAVNNVNNAFTPQGSLDPLSSLVTFGVAIFQAVTQKDIRILIEAVTLTSKLAIGLVETGVMPATSSQPSEDRPDSSDMRGCEGGQRSLCLASIPADLFPTRGDPADFVVLHGNKSLRSAALHPAFERTTVKAGKIVAKRGLWRWFLGGSTGTP